MGLNTVRPNHAPGAKYFISTGKDVPYCSECPPGLHVSFPVHAGTTGSMVPTNVSGPSGQPGTRRPSVSVDVLYWPFYWHEPKNKKYKN